MSDELQRLRDALARTALHGELRLKLDPDYASLMAERHRARVTLLPDGMPDPASVGIIAAEIVKTADSKWHAGGNVYDEIRRTMQERRERETRERQYREESLKRLAGGN